MSRVLFMSVNELKEYTTINYNVEDKLLENSIYDAQNIDLQAILGSRLYISLQDRIISNTITGTTDTAYKTLLDDYIFWVLLKASEIRGLMWIYAKIRAKGITNQDSDNSATVDITIVNKMKQELNNDFEFYSNKLKNYLCEVELPEYKDYNPDTLDYYTTPNTTDSFFSGIHLEGPIKGTYDWRNKR